MPSKPKKRKKADNMSERTKLFIRCQIFSAIVYTGMFLICSIVALSMNVPKNMMFYLSVAAFAVSSFACGFYAGMKSRKNGITVGLLNALLFNTLVMLISMLVNSFKIDFTTIISYVILLICSMLGGIVSVNTRQKPKVKVKKG